MVHEGVRRWLQKVAPRTRRYGSVCTGAFVLASAGLLDGKRVATHWASCARLAERFPAVSVDAEALYVVDGKVWTSAGVTTGIDMALALVEADLGAATANLIARHFVLYARRPGYQSQFSPMLQAQATADAPFAALIDWMQDHLDRELDVPTLARHAGYSERSFYRKFTEATGKTPAHFVEDLRLDAARTLLSKGLSLKLIAGRVGLKSSARLGQAFERRFGMAPVAVPRDAARGRECGASSVPRQLRTLAEAERHAMVPPRCAQVEVTPHWPLTCAAAPMAGPMSVVPAGRCSRTAIAYRGSSRISSTASRAGWNSTAIGAPCPRRVARSARHAGDLAGRRMKILPAGEIDHRCSRIRKLPITSAVPAKPAPSQRAALAASAAPPPEKSNRPNISATSAAPIVWPSVRAVAMMPPALPLRSRGTAFIISRLLGAAKMPKPAPHSTSRHMMSTVRGIGAAAAPSARRPAVMLVRPIAPSTPA